MIVPTTFNSERYYNDILEELRLFLFKHVFTSTPGAKAANTNLIFSGHNQSQFPYVTDDGVIKEVLNNKNKICSYSFNAFCTLIAIGIPVRTDDKLYRLTTKEEMDKMFNDLIEFTKNLLKLFSMNGITEGSFYYDETALKRYKYGEIKYDEKNNTYKAKCTAIDKHVRKTTYYEDIDIEEIVTSTFVKSMMYVIKHDTKKGYTNMSEPLSLKYEKEKDKYLIGDFDICISLSKDVQNHDILELYIENSYTIHNDKKKLQKYIK